MMKKSRATVRAGAHAVEHGAQVPARPAGAPATPRHRTTPEQATPEHATPEQATPEQGAPAAVVEVRDLVVVRGHVRAVDGVSFATQAGQVTGLLGPSGSGKTTLMRALVGVQIITSGSVEVLGLPAGRRELRDRVGYVTQAPSVYDDLSVGENLRFFARVLGLPGEEVDRCIEAVDLTDLRDRVVNRLSGGQRSRVSLAVALLGSPELLVLDEPTVGLDPVLRRDLWDMFHRLADQGTAVIVSSHVMDEAERCDRLLLMRAGRLLADDAPGQLLRRTGTEDIEKAFLALVEGQAGDAPAKGELR